MKFITVLVCCLYSLKGLSQNKSEKIRQSLVAAENNFAATAQSHNIKTAFEEVLDEHSLVFRPDPVNGRFAYKNDVRPDSAYLFWRPEWVEVSLSGDFGFSTGPWFARKSKYNPESRKGFGSFITIWKKDKQGNWKVVLDKGVSYQTAGERKADLAIAYQESGTKPQKLDLTDILEMDSHAFGGKETDFYDAKTYFFQHNKWPFKNEKDSLLSEFKTYDSWIPMNGDIASSGDLAYTYGKFSGFINSKKQEGYYLRIWKRVNDNNWKIVIDLRTEN